MRAERVSLYLANAMGGGSSSPGWRSKARNGDIERDAVDSARNYWLTRISACRIQDLNTHCLDEFRKHWQCLDNENHQLWQCRPEEWKLNKCVFDKLGLVKTVPDQPKNSVPVHLRAMQHYARKPIWSSEKPFVPETTKPASAGSSEKAAQ